METIQARGQGDDILRDLKGEKNFQPRILHSLRYPLKVKKKEGILQINENRKVTTTRPALQ